MKDKQLLQSLKSQLSQFKTFDCKLKHEEVINIEFNTGTDYSGKPLELSCERIGFCNKAYRNSNISCAHTIAAINFKKIFNEIIIVTDYKGDDLLIQSMDELLCKIYLLDIEKGSLEKQHAYAKFNELPALQSALIEEKITNAVNTHSNYVQELEILRQMIMNEIFRIIF